MYRTGDVVKLVDGKFYFLGRKDNQIKHMGYRIELEEIETALSGIAGVNQSAVIYQRDNTSYGKIIAFIASEKELDPMFIGRELKAKLPSYMLPSKLIVLDSLPKNANGKVDKEILGDY
jgi:D-alanine--poly(phosphoribitol) ligase subunit 1